MRPRVPFRPEGAFKIALETHGSFDVGIGLPTGHGLGSCG